MSAALAESPTTIGPITEAEVVDVAAIEGVAFSRGSFDQTQSDRVVRLREELARPWARVWVARVEGRPVAFVLVWNVVDEVHILNLATLPAERRRGHARALLGHVIRDARATQKRHLLLEVRRSNAAAIALYRRHAFAATGLRRRYYDDQEDAVEMALTLDPTTGENVPRTDEVDLD